MFIVDSRYRYSPGSSLARVNDHATLYINNCFVCGWLRFIIHELINLGTKKVEIQTEEFFSSFITLAQQLERYCGSYSRRRLLW